MFKINFITLQYYYIINIMFKGNINYNRTTMIHNCFQVAYLNNDDDQLQIFYYCLKLTLK